MEPDIGSPDEHMGTCVEPSTVAEDQTAQLLIAAMVNQQLFSRSSTKLRVGRFIILDELGRGGMGVVYSAYDEQLDRKVAVKVLLDEASDQEAQRRFHREAQAMARLSHPNVVTVHEVGEDAEQSFLAMEFIRGKSLVDWLRTEPGWPAVLTAFVQAGEGLAAAHQAGLVHRDLKPHNIMRREDGVVKVLDFGLARAADDDSETDHTQTWDSAISAFTRTGMVMGTPAYMAPEQIRGEAADARSDQFSFCVALYEGLYGVRPFEGHSLETVLASIDRQALRPIPRGSKVPATVREVVMRGLARDPAQRWPSMSELLEPLRRQVSPRRRRWGGPSVALALVGLGAVGVASYTWLEARAQQCSGAAQQLAGVWDDTRRAEVEAAIVGIGKSYADDVWVRTEGALDEYATDWMAMHTEACEATTVRGEQSTEVQDLRMACLHRAKVDLRAVTQVLADADAETVTKAHELTALLRPLPRCADVEALQADVEPPLPHEEDAVETLREHLARAKAEIKAGHYDEAKLAVDAAEAALREVEYGPVKAEVALTKGTVLERLGQYPDAEAALREALRLASRGREWEVMQEAETQLVFVVGYKQKRFVEGLFYADLAQALAAGDPNREARIDSTVASVHRAMGAYTEAATLYERALAIWEKALGPEHPDIAASLNNFASLRREMGAYAEAATLYERALAIQEKALGPEHPTVATVLNNLATVRKEMGAYAEAETLLERALAILEKTLGPEHPTIAMSLDNLATIHATAGSYAEAVTLNERALAIREKTLGPEHPDVAVSLNNLATVRRTAGAYAEAATLHERALAIREKALGPEHPTIAISLNNLANVRFEMGAYAEAATLHERALTIREKTLGPEHPDVAVSLNNLANLRKKAGAYAEAATLYERALAILEKALGPAHPTVAGGLNNLANARFEMGAYAEAATLYERALTIREEALGPKHLTVADSLVGLANVALAQDRGADAVPLAERALAVREASEGPATGVAEAQLVLARALIETKASSAKAVALAERARHAFVEAGAPARTQLTDVEAFLRKHSPAR